MDTNKNVGINEFSGGMNFDLNYNTLQHNLYIYGENIRLTSNALINQGENPDKKEGVVSPIPEGILVKTESIIFDKILAIELIDNICVVVVEKTETVTVDEEEEAVYKWSVYRITYNSDKTINVDNIFNSTVAQRNEIPKFSTVINKEVNGIIKLYIADGKNEIMVLNVNSDYDEYNRQITESQLISNNYFPKNKVRIINTISGRLPVGLVQYTYRFYKKYSIKSKLAPLTNKILIINSTKNKEQGNAEDTTTSMGLLLRIDYDDECKQLFDKVQIFRIYYKQINVDADIELIYDEKINTDSTYIKLNDVGKDALKEYTAEEFSLLDGQDIIPQCIEHNQGYMFAANVLDKTIINKELGEFDARAFSANSGGDVVLYADTDTEYQDNFIDFSIDDVELSAQDPILLSDMQQYTLNKYADMNIDSLQPEEVCKYDKGGFLGGTGRYVSWRFVSTRIPIGDVDQQLNHLSPSTPESIDEPLFYLSEDGHGNIIETPVQINGEQRSIKSIFEECNVDVDEKISYENIFTSSLVRSLRRDEVYRYGIILYDENGRRSDVNWIADIKTPSVNLYPIIETTSTELNVLPVAVMSLVRLTSGEIGENGLPAAVGTGGEKRKSFSFNRTVTCDNDLLYNGYFNTAAGDYIFVDTLTATINADIIIYGYDDLGLHVEGLSDLFNIQNALCRITCSSGIDGVLVSDLQRYVTNTMIKTPVNSSWITSSYGSISNINAYITNIIVHFDGNELPIEEYNNSAARLQAHTNVLVTAEFNFEFDICCEDIGVSFSIGPVIKVYASQHSIDRGTVYAKPIGILFDVHNLPQNIIGYQIVRCSKNSEYRKNIMLCVAAVPIRQQITENEYSPYYPHYLLTTNPYGIYNAGLFGFGTHNIYGKLENEDTSDPTNNTYSWYSVESDNVPKLLLLYSPEITNRREDSLQTVHDTEDISFFGFIYDNNSTIALDGDGRLMCFKDSIDAFDGNDRDFNKLSASIIIYYYKYDKLPDGCIVELKQIQDVKNPLWEDAYSNVLLGSVGSGENEVVGITSATKQYKSYVTSISDKEYVNWICNAMYDIKGYKIDVNKNQHYDGWAMITKKDLVEYSDDADKDDWYIKAYDIHGSRKGEIGNWFKDSMWDGELPKRVPSNTGLIGPGPVCFIATTEMTSQVYDNIKKVEHGVPLFGTTIANLRHKPILYAGLSNSDKTLDVYYGFGNFCTTNSIVGQDDEYTIVGSNTVFDGDVYIVPFEIVLMFKTYDFNSDDTLQSAQFVYYVPIETPINTYFDYGMNYRNTLSKTLLLEPGEISGVSSQDRPLSQYSMILSDNSTSNDIYNARYNEDETSEFKCRIWFSNQKISGEYIDNWLIYSPLDYTDGDSRFGDITCLTSMKDAIYCWQDRAFGRISVNERSLVKDTNSNMIQLGTGGVVQRVDYIDTIHGMSPNQYVCEDIANRIFWIDDKNKVVMMSDGTNAINLSEQTNVQGLLNGKFSNDSLAIGYDSLSDELLCKCLNNGRQLVFNTKLNLATSVYTRNYLETFRMHNELFGINNSSDKLRIYKFGGTNETETTVYMPSVLLFVVNDNSSITKVFDNQEIVFTEANNDISSFNEHSVFEFDTNTTASMTQCGVDATYYEGNVRYAIPREQCADYGQRMRGKWLKVSINLDGSIQNAISHVLTKFRQSF